MENIDDVSSEKGIKGKVVGEGNIGRRRKVQGKLINLQCGRIYQSERGNVRIWENGCRRAVSVFIEFRKFPAIVVNSLLNRIVVEFDSVRKDHWLHSVIAFYFDTMEMEDLEGSFKAVTNFHLIGR